MAASTAVDGVDLDEIYAFTVQLAKEAGQMLLAAVDARSGKSGQAESTEKESAVDIVTQTDEGEWPSMSQASKHSASSGILWLLQVLQPSFCYPPTVY